MNRLRLHLQKKPYVRLRVAGFLLVVLVLVATFYVWLALRASIAQSASSSFNHSTDRESRQLADQFDTYADTLYDSRAFVLASNGGVDQSSWDTFVKAQNITTRYPAITSLDYVSMLTRSEVPAFLQKLRADQPSTPGITIYPASSNDRLAVLTYYSSLTDRSNLVGYDLMTNRTRASLLDQAGDDDLPRASTPLTLTGDHDTTMRGIVIALPVYKPGTTSLTTPTERRDNLQGFVVMGVHIVPAVAGAINQADGVGELSTLIKTGNETVYTSGTIANGGNALQKTTTLILAGQPWTITYRAPSDYGVSWAAITAPFVALPCGVLIALLLAITISYGADVRAGRTTGRS